MGQTDITAQRQAALESYAILDTPTEAEFDDIVKVASEACGMPVSLISLLDTDRQWFKAEIGFGQNETPLSQSICAYAAEQKGVFEIPDLTQDPRTASNPLVIGGPQVRYYAGVPLETADGLALGALCVLDTKPNRLNPVQAFTLRTLARQVMINLELRRALKERRESDRRNQAILESAVDYGIIAMDLAGIVTSWNAGAEQILGWTQVEMLGRHAHVFFTDEDTKNGIPEKEMGAALLHGRGNDERWHVRKDGSTFWANGEMMPLKDESGKPEGFIKILRDRTAQRLAAERQRADAEFMRSVLASSADCIKVLDLDAKLTFMNEGGKQVMEVSDFNLMKGCPWPDFWEGQGNVEAKTAVAAARAGGTGHFQGAADTMKGTPKWWDVQVTPIFGADGQPERLLAVSRDVTAQKAAETELATSEERWRSLFSGMQEGFFLAELVRDMHGQAVDYRYLQVNPAFARQSGLPADCVGQTIRNFVPDIDQDLIDRVAQVVETGEPTLFEVDVPGLDRWFEVRVGKERGERFSCLFLDVTARKLGDMRRAAMIELGDRLRDVSDTAEIARVASEILGHSLRLSHAGYGTADVEAETVLVQQEWTAPGVAEIGGIHEFRAYGSYIENLKAGEVVVISDIAEDPRTQKDNAAMAKIHTRALINLPMMEHGRFVSLVYALKPTPHNWTQEEIGFVRNVADRTRAAIARAEAEAQQRTLNLELSHRMKNMLAMVQSIATQTMRNAADMDSAKNVLANRLIALSKSHDLLLGGALNSTEMRALIESALHLHMDQPDRFVPEGPALTVGAKAAMSLSLILHELATNAVKYGALSVPAGRVSLIWEVIDGATVRLQWSESGGPLVTPPTRTGFGTRLIGRGLAGNFGGTVTLDYPATGVVCTIVAPATGLQAEDAPPAAA